MSAGTLYFQRTCIVSDARPTDGLILDSQACDPWYQFRAQNSMRDLSAQDSSNLEAEARLIMVWRGRKDPQFHGGDFGNIPHHSYRVPRIDWSHRYDWENPIKLSPN